MKQKPSFYAIAKGVDPETGEAITNKIVTDWNECKKYVLKVDKARYKGFVTEEEAKLWIEYIHKTESIEEKNTNNETKKFMSQKDIDEAFNKQCKAINMEPEQVIEIVKSLFVIGIINI